MSPRRAFEEDGAVHLVGPYAAVQMQIDDGTRLVGHEVWERDCYRLKKLARGRVLVDIGANVGAASLAAIAYGATRSIAVEPDEINLRWMRLNLEMSGVFDMVTLEHCAVGTPRKAVMVHRSAEHPDGCYGSSWTGEPEDGADAVPQRRLDDFLPEDENVLLKIDAEGAEYEILGSCPMEILRERVGRIVVEWHHLPGRGLDSYELMPAMAMRLMPSYDLELTGVPGRSGLLFAKRHR